MNIQILYRGSNMPTFDNLLKGVFAKNERGYRLTVINKSLLIFLLSVASIMRKRLIPKNVDSIQIKKVATQDSDRNKINLIPNKAFRYYKLQSSIIFRRICIQLIFHNIFYIVFFKINILLTTCFSRLAHSRKIWKMSSSLSKSLNQE